MRFVSVVELKNKASQILREVGEGEKVIVTRHGKPTALIVNLSEDDLEDWLLENNPRLKRELDEAYARCLAGGGRPMEEVVRELLGQPTEEATPKRQRKAS